jgi:hypothetical protein
VLLSLASTQVGAQQAPVPALDHFKCYDAKGEELAASVQLKDQFTATDRQIARDQVVSAELFCNATRKIHEGGGAGISDLDNHLTWYRIKPEGTFQERQVLVTNQFVPNGQRLTVVQPAFLAVPTQKLAIDGKRTGHDFPRDLDHFRCYDVKADPIDPASVRLWDQFGPNPPGDPAQWDAFRVRDVRYLCNPTAKRHFDAAGNLVGSSAVQHPEAHLTCYQLDPDRPAEHSLAIRNQFGPEQRLRTVETELLCVPSAKRELR